MIIQKHNFQNFKSSLYSTLETQLMKITDIKLVQKILGSLDYDMNMVIAMTEGQMASEGSPPGAWICYSSPVVKSSVSTLILAPATNSSQSPSNMSCIPQKRDTISASTFSFLLVNILNILPHVSLTSVETHSNLMWTL